LFMLPMWEEASGGWMERMMASLSPYIATIATGDSQGQTRWREGIPIHSLLPAPSEIRYMTRLFGWAGLRLLRTAGKPQKALRQALDSSQVGQVFCQYGAYAAEFMDVWRETDIPLFIHFHGYDATFDLRRSDDPEKRRFGPDYQERILELSRRATFIANSHFTARLLVQADVPAERVRVKYFGIETSAEKRRHEKKTGIIILHLGRLVDFKSPDRTIRAFESARAAGLDGQLVIAGDGPLRATCELLRSRSVYKESIRLLGEVSSADAHRLLGEADIYTQHNIQGEITRQCECFGVSILEAMANGLPVVGTKHGGVLESVVDGETGFLNEPGDVEAQAQSLIELANSPGLRQQMGEAGRLRVAACFSPQQEIEQLRQIMKLPKLD